MQSLVHYILPFRFLTMNENTLTNQIHSIKSLPKWFSRVQSFGKVEKRSSFSDFLMISKRFYNIFFTHINKRCDSQDHNDVFPLKNKCFPVIFKDRTWRSIFTKTNTVWQKSHNVINDLIQVIVLKIVAEFLDCLIFKTHIINQANLFWLISNEFIFSNHRHLFLSLTVCTFCDV